MIFSYHTQDSILSNLHILRYFDLTDSASLKPKAKQSLSISLLTLIANFLKFPTEKPTSVTSLSVQPIPLERTSTSGKPIISLPVVQTKEDLNFQSTMVQPVISEEYCSDTERELTVRKTSLFAQGDGFAVYDHCTGELAFRVDMYPSVSGELVLMDPDGAPVLTVRKKRPSLHNRWEGFAGERVDGQNQKPLFTVRRSSIFGGDRAGMVVEVHGGVGPTEAETEYRIEGSFSQRCCKVLFEGTATKGEAALLVAEIKRKVDPDAHVVMGKDVFSLFLAPHVDAAFIMGLVLVLDQVCSDEPGIAEEEIDLSSATLADHHVIANGGTLLEEHPAEVVM